MPAPQSVHTLDELAPDVPEYFPATHATHPALLVVPVPDVKLPVGHDEQTEDPVPAANVPAGQAEQGKGWICTGKRTSTPPVSGAL